MINSISSLQWNRTASGTLAARIDGGCLLIQFVPNGLQSTYSLKFVTMGKATEFLGMFTSEKLALAAADTWVGDSE